MKKSIIKTIFAVTVASLLLTACGGGSGSESVTGGHYTHRELAEAFVTRLNRLLGYDVDLVKVNTRQYDYIVVYDGDLDEYTAYDLDYYNVGEDLENYLRRYSDYFYHDLRDVYGNESLFEDPLTGVRFKIAKTVNHDLGQLNAHVERLKINSVQNRLVTEFGFSQQKAQEVATLAIQFSNTDKDTWTKDEVDEVTRNMLGVSYSEIISASSDTKKLVTLWREVASELGVTSSQVMTLASSLFSE